MRPNFRTWVKHILLLLLTFVTCTIAGVIYPFGRIPLFPELNSPEIAGIVEVLALLPFLYFNLVVQAVTLILTNTEYLLYGLSFSVSVLFILISHEMGHYIACRIYRVDATLPYFIPTPPLVGPAGTLGAFIKIVSPMPSRKAVFDIGVAGPIAGFIAIIPVAGLAFLTMDEVPREIFALGEGDLYFSDPLFMRFFALLFGRELQFLIPNGFYFATWLGLLVTALNLIPSGQLDGGHAIYAVFGERVHYWTGRIAFVAMALFSIFGLYFFNSPSGLLFAVILAVMMRIKHPQPISDAPLDPKRKLLAFLTLIIFILCFVPFPIKLN
ncbi:MAG: site-2 protease family protein [Pyrinomonadaceae bacterium]|nr:site-2 protease family protein [Pyrinomonadaceae bacterium]